MAFPVVASIALAGTTVPAVLLALSVVAGFLAHEPLEVLLARRGARARTEHSRRAVLWLAVTTTAMIVGGATAWLTAPTGTRWSILVPLVPASILAVAVARDEEKTLHGEVAAAVAFAAVAVPGCVLGGVPARTAFAVSIVFASLFVTGTLAVRVTILRVRAGGNPRAERTARLLTLSSIVAISTALITCGAAAWLPWTITLAVGPGLMGAAWLALFPPVPQRLRTVGWTLVAAAAAAMTILVAGLRT